MFLLIAFSQATGAETWRAKHLQNCRTGLSIFHLFQTTNYIASQKKVGVPIKTSNQGKINTIQQALLSSTRTTPEPSRTWKGLDTLPRAGFFDFCNTPNMDDKNEGQGYGSSILSHSGQSQSSPAISSSDLLWSLSSLPVPAVQPSLVLDVYRFRTHASRFLRLHPSSGFVDLSWTHSGYLFTWPLTMLICQSCTEPNFVQ